jgi:hypothetical protein
MRKMMMILSVGLLVGLAGCGKQNPMVVTPEMEAEQKQAEKDVQQAESANRRQQKPGRTFDQQVEDEERNRRR